jgi:hypothetical protein
MPLNRDGGKRDGVGGHAVSHDPDAVRAGGCVLPDEVRLAVTVEVLRNPSTRRRAWGGRRRARRRRRRAWGRRGRGG